MKNRSFLKAKRGECGTGGGSVEKVKNGTHSRLTFTTPSYYLEISFVFVNG